MNCGNGATGRPAKRLGGITLIELLVVLVAAAVLMAIAVGSYQEQIRSSRRAEARRTLLEAALALEQNFTLALRFDRDAAGAPMADGAMPLSPPFPAGLLHVGAGADGAPAYLIRFSEAPTPDAFTLIAVRAPGGPMSTDACGDFTLDHTGRRSIVEAAGDADATRCWERARP